MKKRIDNLTGSLSEVTTDFQLLIDEMRGELSIDVYNLEGNCATHAESFFNVALWSSKIGLLCHKSELLVKEVKAEIANDVRTDPEKYGIVKLTESQVMEAIDSSEIAQKARNLRAECTKLKTDADSLVQAFEHRRSMLNNEVQLYMCKLSEPRREAKRDSTIEKILDNAAKGGRKRVKEC